MPTDDLIPPDGSMCEKCKKGVIRWYVGGATCQWCGRTWEQAGCVNFCDLPEGATFLVGNPYPDSPRYPAPPETLWVKAENAQNLPGPKAYSRVNAYQPGSGIQGAFGPMCRVVPAVLVNEVKSLK